jgi:nuclear pore complex protein Nup98-Nup96
MYALDCGDVWEAYELYITAQLYNEAHELAVNELAPDAIIRQDLNLLSSIFSRFTNHAVAGWHHGGKVCYKFFF